MISVCDGFRRLIVVTREGWVRRGVRSLGFEVFGVWVVCIGWQVEGADGDGSLDFRGTVPEGIGKTRLDAWLAGQLPLVSRARVQSNIRQGLILVNGNAITKVCMLCFFSVKWNIRSKLRMNQLANMVVIFLGS